LVINPLYVGKGSIKIRRLVLVLSGAIFLGFYDWLLNSYFYNTQLFFYTKMSYNYRRCMETLDYRYLIQVDLSDNKINNYNTETNKYTY
jgi:hypothetical protein